MYFSLVLCEFFLFICGNKLAFLDNGHEVTQKMVYGELEVLGVKFSSECVCKEKPQKKRDLANCIGLTARIEGQGILNPTDLQEFPLMQVSKQSFSCIDGRVENRGYSTPGGDAGEFLLALHLYEHMSSGGQFIDYLKIKEAFSSYLRYTRADKFSFCTDEKTLKALYRQASVLL